MGDVKHEITPADLDEAATCETIRDVAELLAKTRLRIEAGKQLAEACRHAGQCGLPQPRLCSECREILHAALAAWEELTEGRS